VKSAVAFLFELNLTEDKLEVGLSVVVYVVSKNDPNQYAHLVKDPEYVCKSCGRVVAKKEYLCSPVMLGTWED
jgi:hypothetical protein